MKKIVIMGILSGMAFSCFGYYFALHQQSVLSTNNTILEKEPQEISNPTNRDNISFTEDILIYSKQADGWHQEESRLVIPTNENNNPCNSQQEHYLQHDNQQERFIVIKSMWHCGELVLKKWVVYFNLLQAVQLHRINFVQELLTAGARDYNNGAYNYAVENGFNEIAALIKDSETHHQQAYAYAIEHGITYENAFINRPTGMPNPTTLEQGPSND
jgi:hypothetical protein